MPAAAAHAPRPAAQAEIAPGILLDSRRALIHRDQGWMAVADLHYGYEVNRRRHGAMLPGWGIQHCLHTLQALVQDHRPHRLILVGDIMDGSGSAAHTAELLTTLEESGIQLILIEGNHDKPALKKARPFHTSHGEGDFIFHHGHLGIAPPSVLTRHPGGENSSSGSSSRRILITGHQHPAVSIQDGAGLRLKIPVLVQQRYDTGLDHWILPAFSPWAAGGTYTSEHPRLATWACAHTRVWPIPH